MLNQIRSYWLTLNRNCQLRCSWCYAKTKQFNANDNLDLTLAKDIVKFCRKMRISRCTLLGGEPTIYKHIFELLEYIKSGGTEIGIVSNGVRFSNYDFTQKIKSYITGVTVSLKAGDEDSFKKITYSNQYDNVILGIKNLAKLSIPFNVSVLLSRPLQDEIVNIISLASSLSVPFVQVDSCNPTINGMTISGDNSLRPDEIADKTIEIYEKTKNLPVKINFAIRTPFCLFPKKFIQELRDRDCLISGCQLHRQDGIIFGTSGEILPCNLMCDHPIGYFKADFNTTEEFQNFIKTDSVKEFYTLTRRLPSSKCADCVDYVECCGGCLIKWLYYNPEEYI